MGTTTRELARSLRQLAKALEAGPETNLESIRILGHRELPSFSTDALAVNLSTLAGLSKVDKKQWSALIADYDLPINIRPRDASRDVLGKLLKYLEKNSLAREDLRRKASSGKSQKTSPELVAALQALLGE